MPTGPGRYDQECAALRERCKARAALVMVLGGELGDGFSVQAPLSVQLQLPALLRRMADDIERTIQSGGHRGSGH